MKIHHAFTCIIMMMMLSLSGTLAGESSTVPTSAQEIRPLPIGAAIPEVMLKTAEGTDFNLKTAVLRKPTVLIFYRGGWCPYCNLQLGQLQTVEPELLKLGYQILAISPDRPAKLVESVEKDKLSYTLLSDSSMTAAKAFGIAFRVDEATLKKYKGHGIDLEAASGEKHHLLPVPAVFIVGTDGRIKFVHADPDYKVRLEPEALLSAAKEVSGDVAESWMTDFAQAKKEAAKRKVPILVNFSGSDWCGWCIRLDKEVFSQPEFKAYAKKNLVLFVADFPQRKPQAAAIKRQNRRLAERFGVQGFPTVLLVDASGKVLARTGYREGGAALYVKHLEELVTQ
jgi:peroxiredoxin